jgi:uncharacterized protein (DUF2147 family)
MILRRLLNTARIRSALAGMLLLFVSTAQGKMPEPKLANILGAWQAPDYGSNTVRYVVTFKDNLGQFEGRITKVLEGGKEVANPICNQCIGELKNKSLLNVRIIYSLKRKGSHYEDGYLLDPLTGNVYDCQAWDKYAGGKLLVRAYKGFFYRSHTWSKID